MSDEPETPVEPAPKKRKPPGGAQRGAGRPKGFVPANRMLHAMRQVFKQEKSKDVGPAQVAMREFMEKDLKGFLHAMRLAETQHRLDQPKVDAAPKGKVVPAGAVSVVTEAPLKDEGHERVVELVNRLLDEWDVKSERSASQRG